jgi:hypothetical protein
LAIFTSCDVQDVTEVAKAKRLADSRAEKRQQKEAADTAKVVQLSQNGKRPASQKVVPKQKRQRCAVEVQGGVTVTKASLPSPTKASHTRTIRAPKRYSGLYIVFALFCLLLYHKLLN